MSLHGMMPPVIRNRIALGAIFVLALTAQAATRSSRDGLWTDIDEPSLHAPGPGTGERWLVPKAGRTVTLDVNAFQALAAAAPMEFSRGAAAVMTLPMPDGSFAQFAVEESPMMDAQLAAQLPDVKTYRARGIDDPAAVARLDFTEFGFHGIVLSPAGTVYIDPYRRGDVAHYISYWRRDYERPVSIEPFHCDYAQENAGRIGADVVTSSAKQRAAALAANGATLRTYRLALACTGEYAAFYGGTVSGAQAGMVTTVNRINAVYEQEVAVRLTMVANSSICFTNATTDPYTNTSSDLAANQTTVDLNIGSANYDIGHLFGTGGGGVASLGVVCVNASKARGLTGSDSPVGDPFDIDFVAHEMGHQFDGDHTFNGTTGNCGGGNRTNSAAYEVGSGSTIMAYAGICGAEDLQLHSDAYFHTKSFDQIVAFIAGTGCPVQTATGDTAPVVNAGTAINIPMSTPFYLTGSATDADGDTLTYCWEEFDHGAAAPPNTDNGTRTILRSFNPVTSPVRTFPQLFDILNNVSSFGESLPITTRNMTFRLTARDGRGGVNYASTTVAVTNAAGPFVVTAPNTAVSWQGNSAQNVTWNVASTTAAPVNCANVKILLSTDGGTTFPTTLISGTPNDGSQSITVPNTATTTARVRVECMTQPFFDVSNANFTIAAALTVTATATTSTNVAVSWNAIAGAAHYDVFRKAAGGDFVLVGSSGTTSFNDTTAAANTAYLYAVRSVDGSNVSSALSAPDLATTVIFTDPALASIVIKAVHVTELRTAINAVRALAGLSPATFTSIGSGTVIAAVHINELRTALDAARSSLSLAALSYTDASLTAGTPVRATHVQDLRGGVQ